MRVWLLALTIVAACARKEPMPQPVVHATDEIPTPVRPAAELARLVHERAADPALPLRGEAGFLEPPSERELEWINDRSLPIQERLEQVMPLFEDCKTIMKRYMARDLERASSDPARATDSTESLRWAVSTLRLFGRLSSALVDEFLPTISPSDPTYAVRMDGLRNMREGAFGMLQGSLITLQARRSHLDDRQQLAAVWRLHAPRYAALWQPQQCTQLVEWIREVRASEPDAAVGADLDGLATALAACRGPS